MVETKAPIYMVATANDVNKLAPELVSRFDDVFWCDLPNQKAREEILTLHLAKREQNTSSFNVKEIAESMWGYTGREIEKVVKAALELAFFKKQELQSQHLFQATSEVVPISEAMHEKIERLRAWAKTHRARIASEPIESKPTSSHQSAGRVFEDETI